MSLLDRYIVSDFLKFLFLSLLAIVIIFVVVDLFEDLDKFIDRKVSVMSVVEFYLYEIPNIVILITPVALIVSCFLSLGTLSRHNELLAMRSSGVSLFRILIPLFIIGIVVSAGVLIMDELLIPYTNQKKQTVKRVKIDKKPKINYERRWNLYYAGEGNRFYFIGFFDARKKIVRDIMISEYTADWKLSQRLDAKNGYWSDSVWCFRDAVVTKFTPGGEQVSEHFKELKMPQINEVPEDFSKPQKFPEGMNFLELKKYSMRLKRSGGNYIKYLVELHYKLSFPFTSFIIILFGAPLAANLRKTGFAISFTASLTICFVYWGVIQIFRSFGQNGVLPPSISLWIPNIIFLSGGIYLLYTTAKK